MGAVDDVDAVDTGALRCPQRGPGGEKPGLMTSTRKVKDAVYEQFAAVGKAIANPKRFEILDLLSQGPRTVERLGEAASLSTGNVSHHLQALKEARLVESTKEGLYVTYRLVDGVAELLAVVRRLAEQHRAEVDRLYREHFEPGAPVEPVERDDLLERIRRGDTVVIDVRPPEEYAAGHLEGAESVPLEELEAWLESLPHDFDDKSVVAYCRGRYCVMAVKAVETLRARGYDAVRLEENVHDFRSRGLPVIELSDEKVPHE